MAQQTPCAQIPEAHCVPVEQDAPLADLPHELPVQLLPAAQFASLVQAVKQRGPLQVNGAQVVAAGGVQRPPASQVAGPV